MASNATQTKCMRCGNETALYRARGWHFCENCFKKWTTSKAYKRIEEFRVMHGNKSVKNVLLPISFGHCSLSLLAILNDHLEYQQRSTGRVGYRLLILHVSGADSDESSASASSKLQKLRDLYPSHEYLSACIEDELAQKPTGDAEKERTRISVELLSRLSASSYDDMNLIVRQRIIAQYARKHSCAYIVHGDSTSRLSERILAETAKGRGFALPQIIGEAKSEDGIQHLYPLRDLSRNEIEEYSKTIEADVRMLLVGVENPSQQSRRVPAIRNMTIDKLMAQYVPEMEDSSSNIVANVLRTSSKLKQPAWQHSCSVCGLLLDKDAYGLHGWGGDQGIESEAVAGQNSDFKLGNMCYGCTRSLGSY